MQLFKSLYNYSLSEIFYPLEILAKKSLETKIQPVAKAISTVLRLPHQSIAYQSISSATAQI